MTETDDPDQHADTEGGGRYDAIYGVMRECFSQDNYGRRCARKMTEKILRRLREAREGEGDEDWTWERFRRLYLHDARFHACVKRVEQEVWREAQHEYRIALSTREPEPDALTDCEPGEDRGWQRTCLDCGEEMTVYKSDPHTCGACDSHNVVNGHPHRDPTPDRPVGEEDREEMVDAIRAHLPATKYAYTSADKTWDDVAEDIADDLLRRLQPSEDHEPRGGDGDG